MKKIIYISILFFLLPFVIFAQTAEDENQNLHPLHEQEHEHDHNYGHEHYSVAAIDTTKNINYWRITERTGEIIAAQPDTALTDYFNRTNVEGLGLSVANMGNLGLATESRIFTERADRSEFMFLDSYYAYKQTPGKFNFINTKIPYSNISYQTAGSRVNKEERLLALLALNIGKKLNVGFDVDYLYARGYYQYQSAKHLEWVFFANYINDRHKLHLFVNPFDYTNAENGGVTNDNYISHPDYIDNREFNSDEIPTNIKDTWNKQKGNHIYLNYHYNLGFEKQTNKLTEDGDTIMQFVPVSSIIYTLDYKNTDRRFYAKEGSGLDEYYSNVDWLENNALVNDQTSYWNLRNTVGLSMREGFTSWAKFDLTAFLTQDFRNFTLMEKNGIDSEENQNATYVGGELAKRTGKILRYDAQGSFGVLGYNLGDINLSGHVETRIPVLKDTASINLNASLKNLSPTYYENHYHSKYFWWDYDFSKVKKVFLGGNITIPHTRTKINIGVENITDYIYFDENGYPKQHSGDIQVFAAGLEQNFKLRALHWDNQLTYQTSSEEIILPLPDLSLYSSLYIQFAIAKVLTVQLGANVHYWTEYFSPTYEPATQQFRLQKEAEKVKAGNYPLVNGFINCHLKQTRFFLEYYNLGSTFISPPNYFAMPHYPSNPSGLRMGLSIDFHN